MTARQVNMQALYVHIHHLLDEHVAAHLATNYTDYTQLRVYQVGLATIRPKKVEYHLGYRCSLTGLLPIPAEDTHSLLPPSDPLDSLVQEHCHIESLKAWESLPIRSKGLKSSLLAPAREQCHLSRPIFSTLSALVRLHIQSEFTFADS
jgi:hypothetical protein